MIVAGPAWAHLLPKQTGTMKLVDNSANFVIAVPVSALEGVDPDGDGHLSDEEIGAATPSIAEQFNARFSVSDAGAGPAKPAMTWVMSPDTDHSHGGETDYVIVMHRVFFDTTVSQPLVSTDLFGTKPGEAQLSLRATRQIAGTDTEEKSETFVLKPDTQTHGFYVS